MAVVSQDRFHCMAFRCFSSTEKAGVWIAPIDASFFPEKNLIFYDGLTWRISLL